MGFLRTGLFVGGAAIALSLAAVSASAAIITLNSTVDLSLATFGAGSVAAGNYFSNAAALPLTAPFDVSVGDTFNYNLRFAGSQDLTITGFSYLFPLVITKDNLQVSSIDMTGTIDLLGVDGSVIATASKSNSDGSVHIGQVWLPGDFGALPAAFTITGFNYSGVVDAYSCCTTRTYDGPTFYVTARSFEVGTVDVPEPSTWMMLLAGLGLVAGAGVLGRRRSA